MNLLTRILGLGAALLLVASAALAQVPGAQEQVNSQAAPYTVNCYPPDAGKLLSITSGGTVTIPQAGTSCIAANWWVDIQNRSSASVTLSTTTSVFDGAATTLILYPGQGLRVISDGTNFETQRGSGTGGNAFYGPNLVTNGGFLLDQEYEGSGPTPSSSTALRVVDRWYCQWVVSTSGAGNPTISQAATATGNTLSAKELKITGNATAGTTTPAALNGICYQSVEGSDVDFLQLGTANGLTSTYAIWMKASVAGSYGMWAQNASNAQSYSQNCTVAAATWTLCTVTLPNDATGTWNRTPGSIGIIVGITFSCGSTFQQTAGTWATSTSNCTSSQTQLTNNASATLELTAAKLEPGVNATPYIDDPQAVLVAKSRRFYAKSFNPGTAVAQNAGTGTGESCFQTPIATSEGSVTVSYPSLYAAPGTVTTFNPAASNANFRNETGSADVTIGTPVGTATSLYLPTGATVSSIASKVCVHWTVDTGF